MTNRIFWFLFAVSLPTLDVGSLLFLAEFIGPWITLAITFLSCSMGLLACRARFKRIEDKHDQLKEQYGIHLPKDIVLVQGYEAFYELILMFLFVFPGLLSDIVAGFLSIPWVRNSLIRGAVSRIKDAAEQQGMTVREYLKKRNRSKLKE